MLPPFTDDGILLPGIHVATWHEVVERFGGNPRRLELLDGLRRALADLQGAGCRRVYLNGSFVTNKENPGDYDLCWDEDGVNSHAVPAALLSGDLDRIKREYMGDVRPIDHRPGFTSLTALGLFQLRRDGFGFKGIIRLDVEDFP